MHAGILRACFESKIWSFVTAQTSNVWVSSAQSSCHYSFTHRCIVRFYLHFQRIITHQPLLFLIRHAWRRWRQQMLLSPSLQLVLSSLRWRPRGVFQRHPSRGLPQQLPLILSRHALILGRCLGSVVMATGGDRLELWPCCSRTTKCNQSPKTYISLNQKKERETVHV